MTPRRRTQWQLLWLALWLSLASTAWADGKVFARAVGSVNTPDQRAMLHFSNGVERLVIETSFLGPGTNFAWVIPLPSSPKIEAVSTNFFRNLSTAYQPKLVYKRMPYWILFLYPGLALVGLVQAVRKGRPEKMVHYMIWLAVVGLLAAIAIPNRVTLRGTSSRPQASDSVSVLNRQAVGIYDTVTVSGKEGRALFDWLNTHGFHTPPSALPVISSYVNQGWVFVVANINRAASGQARTDLHPLAFTFSTGKPVYPLRLTGVENDQCKIELFVFGPGRAEAPGFQVEHCGRPFEKRYFPDPGEPGIYRISDHELRGFTMPASVTTKLIGNLAAFDMQSDAWIRWVDYKPELPVLYSHSAAMGVSLDWTLGILMLGALTLQILMPHLSRRAFIGGGIAVLIAAATCGVIRFSTIKVTEITFSSDIGWAAASNFIRLDGAIQQYLVERKSNEPLTFESLSVAMQDYFTGGARNSYRYEPIKNEASPGNITLRNSTNGVEVIWYDITGAPQSLATFTNRSN